MPFSQSPSFKPYISEALNIERQLVHQGSDGGVLQKKSGKETKLRLQKWEASTPCQADLTEPTGFQKTRLNGSGIRGKVKIGGGGVVRERAG